MVFKCVLLDAFLFSLLFVLMCDAWKQDRRPKVFGTQMPRNASSPRSRQIQHKIVAYHNYFRANVQPSAANMLEMNWHKAASKFAQKYSEKCFFLKHDNATDRWTENYGGCGQNIFVSTHQVPWFFAIKTWFLEFRNFSYGSDVNELGLVGHYTQMIWATSHKVGCGFSECKSDTGKVFFNYICNYCPSGNYMTILGRPYVKGPSCRNCPRDCSPKTKLCTNFCPFADLWVNCAELSRQWRPWLCKDPSIEGLRRRKHCMATCKCKNKIVQHYPRLKATITSSYTFANSSSLAVKIS